ncbi:MAG TPA: ABC transporter permease [Bryobacteraceae bacterium]|jgi:putative ABC transport system permease protein|nr:ABC transporter permease [Bryobacteraceae bacterium]
MTIGSIGSGVALALTTVREHKMRSFLTVLGVIIGTGAVIGVGSIIAGLDGAITNILKSFGPNTIVVLRGSGFGGFTLEEQKRKMLTYADAVAIAERCPSVEHVSPYLFSNWNQVHKARYKGNDNYQLDIGGTEEAYAAGGTVMLQGRFFTDTESRHHMPVAVLGEDLGKSFFQGMDAVGKWIEVDGHSVEVIGIMERPAASFPGQDDNRILMPYFTMRKLYPSANENMLIVIAYEGMLSKAEDEVRTVLRIQRKVPNDKPDSFSLSTAQQMIEDFHRITGTVALVMVILSSIGLLVGGIGVMNIMLVSVTERTREIGIRKAVGARKSDIIVQFLTEAVVLTGIGGLIGLFLGWCVSLLAGLVFKNLPTAVPLWAAVAGIMVSVGVGLFFGIWPAGRAANLDPVVALRYE